MRSFDDLRAIATFADALPTAIWVGRAPSGECVYVNREFNRILGIAPPEEAVRGNYVGPYGVRKPDGSPYPEADMPYERVMRARGPVVVDDIVIHRHDGRLTHLRVFASPILDDAGEIAYVVEAFTDITREVEAEQARRDSERKVQIAQRLEAIGSLAGGVAHDFNNLLSIVQLVADQLEVTESDPTRLELIGHLHDVAASAAKLTRALLGFAQRSKGGEQVVDLEQIAGSVVELGRRTFGRRLVVEADFAATTPTVRGDGAQIEQVIMNLVLNARDALEGCKDRDGRIVVRTRSRAIGADEHPALAPGDYLVVEVEDDGPGLDPSIRDRVFEPYVSTKTVGAAKGTGLGLATVYGITKMHGGFAEVAATGPGGTTMRVHFRMAPVSRAAKEEAPSRRPPVRGAGTILVVDDEPLVVRFTCLTLDGLGYRAIPATSTAEALEALSAGGESIAAVLLDLTMPGPSARAIFEAIETIRPGLPVVVTTGAAAKEEAQELLDRGARGLLPKPYDALALSRALADALGPAA